MHHIAEVVELNAAWRKRLPIPRCIAVCLAGYERFSSCAAAYDCPPKAARTMAAEVAWRNRLSRLPG